MESGLKTEPGFLYSIHGFMVLSTYLAWYSLVYTLFPLVFHLSICVTSPHILYAPTNNRFTDPIHRRWYIRLFLVFVLIYHFLDTLSYTIFYGSIATLLSPGKTWVLVWAVYAFKKYDAFTAAPTISIKKE
jgi:hypothetical protein